MLILLTYWEEFSDSEEELEALKLIAAADVELLKEYKDKQMTSRSMEGPNTRGMESPNTRGMEEFNGKLSIQEEQEMENIMNEQFDMLSESMNRKKSSLMRLKTSTRRKKKGKKSRKTMTKYSQQEHQQPQLPMKNPKLLERISATRRLHHHPPARREDSL